MGLLNWAMKGVRVEKKTSCKSAPQSTDAVSSTSEQQLDVLQSGDQSEQPQPPVALFDSNPLEYNNHFSNALGGQTLSNRNILVVTPKGKQEITYVVTNLQNGDPCIISFDGVPLVEAQRHLDFLSGVVCAIGGNLRPIDHNKYILTPRGVGVKG